MNLKVKLLILSCATTICSASAQTAQEIKESDTCCQPGRVESALKLIAQAKTIRLRASQSRVDTAAAIESAAALGQQAKNLDAKLRALPPGAMDAYKFDLGAFNQHADAYQAHLAQVEKQLGFCKATEEAYREHIAELSLHTKQFHRPDIRPPHVCVHMGVDEQATLAMSKSLQANMERQAQSEADLANAEAKLRSAAEHNQEASAQLERRSQLEEAERNLAAEFASLRTEYDLLQTQHQALVHSGIPDPAAISKVSAKIKTK